MADRSNFGLSIFYKVLYMNQVLLLISLIFSINLSAQNLKYFELVSPLLGGNHEAGNLEKVVADSQFIYVMGHVPKEIPNSGKSNHPIFASIDYTGKIKKVELLIDSFILNTPYSNQRMIKKNDSIYLAFFYITNPNRLEFGGYELFEVNLRQGKVIKRKRFYDYKVHDDALIFTDNELKDSVFHFVLQDYGKLIPTRFLYEMDLDLNVRKIIEIKYDEPYLTYRWASKGNDDTYDLIVEQLMFSGINHPTGIGFLTYLKMDSSGTIIKKKQLPVKENIFIGTGETYTVTRNEDKSFVFGCNEWGKDPNVYEVKPLIMRTSPEFDSIYWKTNFYPFIKLVSNPRFYMNSIVAMNDGSGFIVSGDWDTPKFAEPDYGLLYKVAQNGDSLWTRKYQPLAWDSLRGAFFSFKQVNCTPYNTIVVAGIASDYITNYQKPWVLHLDKDGCLIPGCSEFVSVSDIQSGKQNAFSIYPNPIVSDHIYIDSRINSKDQYILTLSDLSGKELHKSYFSPQQFVQYLIEIPASLISGEYVLRIRGKEYNQINKIVILK